MKFQDLVAIVGGFVKLITLIFGFVNSYFNAYERDKFIINYFFNSFDKNDEEENNDQTLKRRSNQNFKRKSISDPNNLYFNNHFRNITNLIKKNLKNSKFKNEINEITNKNLQEDNSLKNFEKYSFKNQSNNPKINLRNTNNKSLINDTMQLTIYQKDYENENSYKLNQEIIKNEFSIQRKNNQVPTLMNDSKSNILYRKKDNYSYNNYSQKNSIKNDFSINLFGDTINEKNKILVEDKNQNQSNKVDVNTTIVNNKKERQIHDKTLMTVKLKVNEGKIY